MTAVPYHCKNCGKSGKIVTSSNRPSCPNCGRFMRYDSGESAYGQDTETAQDGDRR